MWGDCTRGGRGQVIEAGVAWLWLLYLEVPHGALPPRHVTASVGVKVILADQFQLPKDRQLISAMYWISSSEVFLKEVAVNI